MPTLTLVFLDSGHAVLEEDGEQVWASDDDEDFEAEIGNEDLTIEDLTTLTEYLVEHDIIDERESQTLSVAEESEQSTDEDEIIDVDYTIVPPTH
jgi:hypothetical protein